MFQNITDKYNVILASGSPRRQQFLKDLHIPFTIKTIEIEEVFDSSLQKEEITNYLAELKGSAFDTFIKENELIITSDTIVWHQKKALGKPKNATEAFAMLKSLSGNTHEVVTSVSFKTTKKVHTLSDITKVYFKNLSDEEINYYIENFKPFDKAGSYGIQEWIGYIGVQKIEGDYTNVMGLPMPKVYNYLKNELE